VAQVKVSLKPEASIAKAQDVQRQLCTIGPVKFEAVIADGEAWITQKQMAELFGVGRPTVSEHILSIVADKEVESVRRNFRQTASDGKSYKIQHYSSEMVQAVGYRVKSTRGVEYRQWVTRVVRGEVEVPKLQSAKPASAIDLFEAQLKAFREQEAKLLSIETTVTRLDQEWSEFKARGEEARAEMRKLPAPTVEVNEKTTRAAINQLIRAAAHARGVSEQDAFRKVYTEFKYRYHIDVDARRDNALKSGQKLSKLDIVEDLGMLNELYALAMHCFK
jgi:DNA polymerase III gamma/tau subunit